MASSLPASWYTSQAHFELEQRAVFSQTWLYATHRSRFQSVGDYHRLELGGNTDSDNTSRYAVFLILGDDNAVRGFHNVCRHRAAPVVRNDSGTARVIGCRYHGWSYNTRGELVKAPSFDTVEGFQRDKHALFPVRVHETKQGFIFVHLAAEGGSEAGDVVPFDEHAPGFEQLVDSAGIDFGQYTFHSTIVRDLDINWKTFVDGFQECYHCEIVHPGLARDFKLAAYKVDTFKNYCRHHCERKDERKDSNASSSGSSDGMWLFVLPNLGLNCYSVCMSTQRAVPLSATKTRMIVEVFGRKDTSTEVMDEFLEYMNKTDREDYDMCLAAQANLNRGIYQGGTLHPVREVGVIYYQSQIQALVGKHQEREKAAGGKINPALPASSSSTPCSEPCSVTGSQLDW